ncbi:unnamed protein product [Candida parapsilosis]
MSHSQIPRRRVPSHSWTWMHPQLSFTSHIEMARTGIIKGVVSNVQTNIYVQADSEWLAG